MGKDKRTLLQNAPGESSCYKAEKSLGDLGKGKVLDENSFSRIFFDSVPIEMSFYRDGSCEPFKASTRERQTPQLGNSWSPEAEVIPQSTDVGKFVQFIVP